MKLLIGLAIILISSLHYNTPQEFFDLMYELKYDGAICQADIMA